MSSEFRVIAPRTKTTRTLLIVLAGLTGLGGVLTVSVLSVGVTSMSATHALGSGLTLLGCGAAAFVALWLWSANVRLLIGHGLVSYRNIFGRERVWTRGEIARGVEMALDYGWWASNSGHGIYVLGLDGRRLLVLSTVAWPAEDLHDFFAESRRYDRGPRRACPHQGRRA